MTPERWRQIETVFHAALARPESERSGFLLHACATDEELRQEVESLLACGASGDLLFATERMPPRVPAEPRSSIIGRRFGAYEVHALLGAGGMGEVYRATDTNLKRQVAIKVLPALVAGDPERLARFQREAEILARLNDPHIAQIYGLEKADGVTALVMELVEGPTLGDRIAKGQIPVEEALPIAQQIAEAFDAAHERGIIHRDLKPANIKITADGRVKVLDFGLAKISAASESLDQTTALATTAGRTREGMIVGTAAYMSPEQARGQPVDKRTDIWAFGCVLFEMLTGRAAFAGKTISDTIAKILEREPDWQALPDATPLMIRRLLQRCLEKDSRRRLRDIGDARLELLDASIREVPALASTGRASRDRFSRWASVALIALAAGSLGWYAANRNRPAIVPPGPTRFAVELPPAAPVLGGGNINTVIALSPDGTRLAFVAGRAGQAAQLWVRSLDQLESRPINSSEGAFDPFFSPDGQWIGFFADQKIKKVSITGGEPVSVCEVASAAALGATWGADDTIFFSPSREAGLWRVPAAGGVPHVVFKDKDTEYRWPQVLPNGKAVLFTTWDPGKSGTTDQEIWIQSFETGERHAVIQGIAGQFANDYLVFTRGSSVLAARFDLDRLEVVGSPRPIVDRVQVFTTGPRVSLSKNGSLAYFPPLGYPEGMLTWVDRNGSEESVPSPARPYQEPRLALNGQRLSVWIGPSQWDPAELGDLWMYDLSRDALSRVTSGGNNGFPVWTPDGNRLIFESTRADGPGLYSKAAEGNGPEVRLTAARPGEGMVPLSSSPDGRTLAFVRTNPGTFADIWMLPLDVRETARPFLQTRFSEGAPVFSPDGRWVAYVSNETGRNEIYVRPFAESGGRVPVSTDGGKEPAWPRSAHELFYRSGDTIMAVDISTAPTLAIGKPRRLFDTQNAAGAALWANYDITADGQRFLMIKPIQPSQARAQIINVELNWPEELQRRSGAAMR